jgi:uncharacterized membrane protein
MRFPRTALRSGAVVAALAAALAACSPGVGGKSAGEDARVPGSTASTAPYDGIAENETLRFTGTEPFWGGEVAGEALTYSTPENADGEAIAVERFAGRGGLSFHGTLDEQAFEMMVTPLECSDGMSDRTYPFTVTLKLGEEMRNGCGWTDAQPFTGPEHP